MTRTTLGVFLVSLALAPLANAQTQPATQPPANPPKPAAGTQPAAGTRAGADSARARRPAGERIEGVAAVVNDEVVLQSEVDEQLYLFLLQTQARPDSGQLRDLRREILDRLIDEKVIVSEAKRQQVSVPEAEIEKQVEEAIKGTKERLGSPEAFAEELNKEGLSEADLKTRYREEVSRQLLANQLLKRQLQGKGEVSPADAEQYFRDHAPEFPKRPATIRTQVILLPVEPDSAGRTAVRRRAQAALARVRKGESFARLAQELSEDPGTARNGGDLGFFKRGQLDSTFEQAAFKLAPGQTSGLVLTPFGYHIIRVEEADKTKGEIHARHILFRIQPSPVDERRARERIEDIRRQATKGMDFGTLARRYSKYQGPAGPDGDLGFLPMTVFSPDFRAALDTLEIGEISQPLANPVGFHLFKVLDREAERTYAVDEIKDQLPELVRQARLKTQYDAFVADLRKKAFIEYR